MSSYYSGKRAKQYNTRWRTFTQRTLAETLAMIDMEALRQVSASQERTPRVLDVGCGTGILLRHIAENVPQAELYGVDASLDMLQQARLALKDFPHVQLEQVALSAGETAGLPYPQQHFDLITCTNVLHDIAEPVEALGGLRRLLSARGTLILEDFARREPPFPWWLVEWLARRIENGHVRAYTLSEAEQLTQHAHLYMEYGKPFVVDWLWHGWVLRLSEGRKTSSAQQ